MSVLVVAGLVAACTLAGGLVLDLAGGTDRDGARPVFAFLAGLLALHLLLQVLDSTPLPWSPWTSGLPLAALALATLSRWRGRRPAAGPGPAGGGRRPGWGDGVALATLPVLAGFALTGRIANPDFVYHWGLKAKKYLLAGGTDYAFLQRAWNFYVHPDYPNLVPELFTVTALLQGRFAESAALLWSVAVTGFLLLACRRLLEGLGTSRAVTQAALGLVALSVLAFSVSWRMTGNADVLMALAVAAAALCLTAEAAPATDLRVGITAAFAAAAKIEGVVFAALLLAVYGGDQVRRRRLGWAAALRLAAPPLLVIVPWWLLVRRHALAQGYYTGDLQLARLSRALGSALAISLDDGWRGISLAALLLLVLVLPRWRRARPLAALCALQLAFYLYVFASAPADTELLVRSSFPRLMLHLVPAILVVSAAALERRRGGGLLGAAP